MKFSWITFFFCILAFTLKKAHDKNWLYNWLREIRPFSGLIYSSIHLWIHVYKFPPLYARFLYELVLTKAVQLSSIQKTSPTKQICRRFYGLTTLKVKKRIFLADEKHLPLGSAKHWTMFEGKVPDPFRSSFNKVLLTQQMKGKKSFRSFMIRWMSNS